MTKRETHITNVIRSRGVAGLLMLAGAWMIWSSPGFDILRPADIVSLLLAGATAVAMIVINRQFNLLRTTSLFFAGLFMIACGATPQVFTTEGIVPALLALTVTGAMWLMFTLYNRRMSDRRIFLIFTLLSAGCILDFTFLFYVPVFLAGMGQMRIFRFKKIVSAIIGLITPWWIGFGLGVLSVPELPHIIFTPPSMLLDMPGGWPFLSTVAFSLLIGFFTGSLSILRILGFNARARAVNGLLALIGIVTGALAIVNFTNLTTYVVLLNSCVAFQVGHFFRATATRRGYIFVLALVAAYVSLYIWGMTA